MKSIILLCVLLVYVNAQADKILSLPLFNGTLGNQYSGYIQVNQGAGRNFHYWFVESQGNPASDPLVLWLNGGPGCSSLDGFLYEHGPFKFAPDATEKSPYLVANPYTWTKLANIIYLESPAGVGFSFSNSASDYNNQNDTRTANDNYTFLKLFYQKYPQFQKNDFWITGESYAGVYVPSLANLVVDGILDKSFVIPFKGVMVGNGVANANVPEISTYYGFLYGHGFISSTLYNDIVTTCGANPNSARCNALENQAENNLNDIDIYNVYGDCYHQRPSDITDSRINIKRTGLVPPCTDAYFGTIYLNLPAVKNAIHVSTSLIWTICSGPVNGGYSRTPNSMVPIYQKLLKNQIRVLIYSGDVDFAVPYTDSAYWTANDMGLTPISEWRPWTYDDTEGTQIGGFVTVYPGGFTFVTVKGSGHMVPQFRPAAAYVLFDRFLHNTPI